MNKRIVFALCMVVVLVGGLMVACAAPTPAPSPAPSPAPEPAPEVISLKFATYDPVFSVCTEPHLEFISAVDERSNGRLKITYYPGETLLKAHGILPGVREGVADIGYICTQYFPEEYVLSNLWALPGMHPTAVIGTQWAAELKEYFDKENERLGLHLGGMHCLAPYVLYAPYKSLKSLDDLKGLQIRSVGGPWTAITEKLGGTPMTMGAWDCYDALVKRTLDVMVHTPGWMFPEGKFHDLADPGYVLNVGGATSTSSALIVNGEKWNSLSPDLQKILDEELLVAEVKCGEGRDANEAKGIALGEAAGIQFNDISDADADRMTSLLQPAYDEYIAEAEAKGLPGRELLEAVMQLKEEWKSTSK